MESENTDVVKLNLRLSKRLHNRLLKAKRANNTSLQQEITDRLEKSFSHQLSPELLAVIAETADRASSKAATAVMNFIKSRNQE
jgi:hypothetical protein